MADAALKLDRTWALNRAVAVGTVQGPVARLDALDAAANLAVGESALAAATGRAGKMADPVRSLAADEIRWVQLG